MDIIEIFVPTEVRYFTYPRYKEKPSELSSEGFFH